MNYSNNTKNSFLAKNGFLGRNLKIRVDDVSIQSFLVLHAKFHFSNFPIFAIPPFFWDTLYIYIYIYIDNCKWLCYPNVGRIWCKDHVRFIGRCSSSRIDYMVKEREEYNTKPTPHAWLVVHIY